MKATILEPAHITTNTVEPLVQANRASMFPTLIRKKELAKRLSVSPRTIDEWVRKRQIPYFQIGPRFYLYDFEAVLAVLRKLYHVDARS